jgi:F-type H+-transporting ATPase subunit delta
VKKDSLTQSYAQAAYEAATDVWLRALTGLQESLDKSPGVLSSLRDPGLDLASKQGLAAPLLPADATQEIRNFVSVLLSRNDIGLLPEIVEQFRRLAIHGPRAQVVRVTSAVELSDEEKSTLAEKLAAQFGANLEFEYKVDSSLLGGLLVRVGDRVIDASVAGKLKALRESLASRS